MSSESLSTLRLSVASTNGLGDWLNYGERVYGEKYSQAMDATGLDWHPLPCHAKAGMRLF